MAQADADAVLFAHSSSVACITTSACFGIVASCGGDSIAIAVMPDLVLVSRLCIDFTPRKVAIAENSAVIARQAGAFSRHLDQR
jgi:hypothetical protein